MNRIKDFDHTATREQRIDKARKAMSSIEAFQKVGFWWPSMNDWLDWSLAVFDAEKVPMSQWYVSETN